MASDPSEANARDMSVDVDVEDAEEKADKKNETSFISKISFSEWETLKATNCSYIPPKNKSVSKDKHK